MLRQPSAPLFAPKAAAAPHGAVALATPDAWRSQAHWHVIGDCFRPLHEQLAALTDARRWALVAAKGATGMPVAAASMSLDSGGMTITTLQHNLDYAVVAIAGEIGGPATQHVRGQIRTLLDMGVRHLVISLSDVLSCDSRLGMVLDRTQVRLRARNGELELVGIPRSMLPYLRVGKLPEALAICGVDAPAVDSAAAWSTAPNGTGLP
jgi:anti-anti-sigma regulatory factor